MKPVLSLLKRVELHALAHITGGGITENLPRALPPRCKAVIDRASLPQLPVYEWLQGHGNISDTEMLKTFNCGVGMVAIVPPKDSQLTIDTLIEAGEYACRVGTVESTDDELPCVEYV